MPFNDRVQFIRAQQRHRRDSDPACFDHGKPASGEHWRIGCAQEYTIPPDEPHFLDKDVGNPVRLVLQITVGPTHAGRLNARAVATSFADVAVEQFRRAIQLRRVLETGQFEEKLRLLIDPGQMITSERIDVSSRQWKAPNRK